MRSISIVLCRIGDVLRWLLTQAVAGLMILIVALVFIQVLARYLFMAPTFGMAEVTRLLFVWLTFVGSALLISKREMIAVDLLHGALSDAWSRRVRVINDLLTALMLVAFAIYGRQLLAIIGPKIAPATGLSYFWFYLSLPVFCGLSLFFICERLLAGRDEPLHHAPAVSGIVP